MTREEALDYLRYRLSTPCQNITHRDVNCLDNWIKHKGKKGPNSNILKEGLQLTNGKGGSFLTDVVCTDLVRVFDITVKSHSDTFINITMGGGKKIAAYF